MPCKESVVKQTNKQMTNNNQLNKYQTIVHNKHVTKLLQHLFENHRAEKIREFDQQTNKKKKIYQTLTLS